jgi:integrase
LISEPDLRQPNPLSWEEQERFFGELPWHLKQMSLFAVNTGCRDSEICSLRWEWEVQVPDMRDVKVFVIPSDYVKNREDRLVVLNHAAREVLEKVRGVHPAHVFSCRGNPITRMLNTGWKKARNETKLDIRVHDLKHTFGRRLRAAGVSYEDRQDLLGHKSGRITTHYSSAELQQLMEAENSVCDQKTGPTLAVLRKVSVASSRKNHARDFEGTNKISVTC